MKQKLLIIGAEGFIGSYLSKNLLNYETHKVVKGSIDVLNIDSVTSLLKECKFDIIVNCLTFGGKEKVNLVDQTIVENNVTMFNNFLLNSDKFSHFVNIGSGSEFDTSKNIDQAFEYEIFNSSPKQSYSYSKNLIARSIFYNNKFTTLRLFGCFGKDEPNIRLLKKYIIDKEIKIIDRYFDYISIQDFQLILNYILSNRITSFDVNCVYKDKIKLSDFLRCFDKVFKRNNNFVIDKISDLNYTGSCDKLNSLNLNLFGLEESFKNFYG